LVLSQHIVDLAMEADYMVTDGLGDLVFEGDSMLLEELIRVDHLLLVEGMRHVLHDSGCHFVEITVEPKEAALVRYAHLLFPLLLLRCLLENLRFLNFHARESFLGE